MKNLNLKKKYLLLLQDIESRIEHLKMNESKPMVFERGETSNRASHAREKISTHERPQGQHFRVNKPKNEYKTPR